MVLDGLGVIDGLDALGGRGVPRSDVSLPVNADGDADPEAGERPSPGNSADAEIGFRSCAGLARQNVTVGDCRIAACLWKKTDLGQS
jgi:hypothetical protein